MDIESLKYFLQVCEYSSFSRAADELCISQSSISKHIKKLENKLNCTLLDRSTKHITLTPYGIIFKEYALHVLECHKNLLIDIDNAHSTYAKLSIGYIPVINQYNVAQYLGIFKKDYKDVTMNLEEGEHDKILNLLFNKEIDFAILRTDTIKSDNLDITPLAHDELVLILPNNHKLAKKKYVSLSEVSNENFILLSENTSVCNLCIKECTKANFKPKIVSYNTRIENILALVCANIGVSLLMKKTVECFNKSGISIVLLKENIKSELCLVHLKNKKLNYIEKEFKKSFIKASDMY